MLFRFISKSSHLRLFTLLSPKTQLLNPKPSSPIPSLPITDPYFFPKNSLFISTFSSDSESNEGTEKKVLDDGSRGREEEATSKEGYKPWSFDVKGQEEEKKVFDVGDEVKVGTQMKGFELEEKAIGDLLKEVHYLLSDDQPRLSCSKPDRSACTIRKESLRIVHTHMQYSRPRGLASCYILFCLGHHCGTLVRGVCVQPPTMFSCDNEKFENVAGSCTDDLTIKKSRNPSVSVYSEEVSKIKEIIKGRGKDLKHELILVASKLSFKCVIEIFDLMNEQRISGFKFFNWLQDSHPEFHRSAYVNSLIICNCGWLDDYKTMFSLLEDFNAEQTCLTDKAFGFLTVLGSSKDSLMNSTKKVVAMLNEVGGSCRGSGIYGLIEMFCCLDLFEMATFVIEITERTTSHYNILIRKRCRAGQIEKARVIIKEMSEFGCSPNTKSYNYLLGSLCKNDKLEYVRIVLEEMRNKGVDPDAITFETLVYHSSSRGQVDLASEFLNLMVNVNVEPRSTTHAAFLKVLLEAGEREKAYKYVIDMSAKYNHCGNTLYSLLVRLNQKKGDIMAAQSLLNEMIDKGLKPDFGIFIKIVKQLEKTSRKTLARDLRTKYSVFYCSTKAINSLSNSFVPCQG